MRRAWAAAGTCVTRSPPSCSNTASTSHCGKIRMRVKKRLSARSGRAPSLAAHAGLFHEPFPHDAQHRVYRHGGHAPAKLLLRAFDAAAVVPVKVEIASANRRIANQRKWVAIRLICFVERWRLD